MSRAAKQMFPGRLLGFAPALSSCDLSASHERVIGSQNSNRIVDTAHCAINVLSAEFATVEQHRTPVSTAALQLAAARRAGEQITTPGVKIRLIQHCSGTYEAALPRHCLDWPIYNSSNQPLSKQRHENAPGSDPAAQGSSPRTIHRL